VGFSLILDVLSYKDPCNSEVSRVSDNKRQARTNANFRGGDITKSTSIDRKGLTESNSKCLEGSFRFVVVIVTLHKVQELEMKNKQL
jgi:hypothetical protein